MARFVVEEDGRPTRSYRFVTDAIVIGRLDTADLVLPDTGVSRKHALVERSLGGWLLTDNGSANGNTVNGAPTETVELAHGDVVGIGKFILTFHTDDETEHPEYTDPHANVGDDFTSPGVPLADLDTLRSVPPLTPEAPPVIPVAASAAPSAPVAPATVAPQLVDADGTPYELGRSAAFGKDIPVAGVLPFVSSGSIAAEESGAVAKRGSFLIPMYVNGESIIRQRLRNGDELRVGSSRFTYRGS